MNTGEREVASITWRHGQPFDSFCGMLQFAAAQHEMIAVTDSNLNPQSLGRAIGEGKALFENNEQLSMIYLESLDAFFVRKNGAFEIMTAFDGKPAIDMRDLITRFRDEFYKGDRKRVTKIYVGAGGALGSPGEMRATMEKEFEAHDQLSQLFDELQDTCPEKAETYLMEMGEAAVAADRTEDVEWQYAWMMERLEDDRSRD